MYRRLVLILLVAGLSLSGQGLLDSATAQSPGPIFRIEQATVITLHGRFPLRVEVAETDEQRSFGLQFRTHLAADQGMLFDFKESRPIFMWMKNTLIPLDMVFIAADGRVTGVAENTTPRSLKIIPSGVPVLGVLEVAAGTAARLGIAQGSVIRHRIFDNVPADAGPSGSGPKP